MLREDTNSGGLTDSMNLGRMLEETCLRHAERVALIHEEKRISYSALNAAVNMLSNRLRKAGLAKGDRIAVMLPNCPEFVIAYFAAQKIGAVAVTLNNLSTRYELRHLLENSGAKCLITAEAQADKFTEIRADLPRCTTLLLADTRDAGACVGDSSLAGADR